MEEMSCQTCRHRRTSMCPKQVDHFKALERTDFTDQERKFLEEAIMHDDAINMIVTIYIPCSAHSDCDEMKQPAEEKCKVCGNPQIKLYSYKKNVPGTMHGKFVLIGIGCEHCKKMTYLS